ncbi:uncharacterized protein LTR77_008094 [Saxophila tyrrhenica]|uniref:Uncharacterized protein n=1 Tax=Saxophila tyrrhenica TaxID=1690608 RepID=A0AAV9P5M2_9PEZI|nr:hypothetical protein LTR77_008094 [Saxophila tyrrhenica]
MTSIDDCSAPPPVRYVFWCVQERQLRSDRDEFYKHFERVRVPVAEGGDCLSQSTQRICVKTARLGWVTTTPARLMGGLKDRRVVMSSSGENVDKKTETVVEKKEGGDEQKEDGDEQKEGGDQKEIGEGTGWGADVAAATDKWQPDSTYPKPAGGWYRERMVCKSLRRGILSSRYAIEKPAVPSMAPASVQQAKAETKAQQLR